MIVVASEIQRRAEINIGGVPRVFERKVKVAWNMFLII